MPCGVPDMAPPLRSIVDVDAIVRFVPVANVPATMLILPPPAIVRALPSVTVLPGFSTVSVPVRFVGNPVPTFWFAVPL